MTLDQLKRPRPISVGLTAMVLALLMSGAVSASASAAPRFTSTGTPTLIRATQSQLNVFTFNAGEFECENASFEGTMAAKEVTAIAVHPIYSGCLVFGRQATVATAGCNYVLNAAESFEIQCESGKSIVVTFPGGPCTISIGAQTPGWPNVGYTDNGTKGSLTSSILITLKLTGISYTSSGGFCGSSGTNGTLTGTMLMKGWTNSAHTTQRGIWWDEA